MLVTFIFSFSCYSEMLIPIINPLTFLPHFLCTVENNHPCCTPASVTYRVLADILTQGFAKGPGLGDDSEAQRRDIFWPPLLHCSSEHRECHQYPCSTSNQSNAAAQSRQGGVALKAQVHMRGGTKTDSPDRRLITRCGLQHLFSVWFSLSCVNISFEYDRNEDHPVPTRSETRTQ